VSTFLLEINPSTNYTAVPSVGWVDITAYHMVDQDTTVNVGGTDEGLDVTPSTFSCFLDNITGNFTPDNAAGSFYPNLTIPSWIRFTADGTRRFTGLVDAWKPTMRGTNSFKATQVTATDILKRLSNRVRLGSYLGQEIADDNPTAYYPLGDGKAAFGMQDVSGNGNPPLLEQHRGIGGGMDFGGDSGLSTDKLSSPKFNPNLAGDATLNAINNQDGPSFALGNGIGGSMLVTTLTTPMVLDNSHAITVEWWVKLEAETVPAFGTGLSSNTKYVTVYFSNPAANWAVGGQIAAVYLGIPATSATQGTAYAEQGQYGLQYLGNLSGTDQSAAQANSILVAGQWYHMVFSVAISGHVLAYMNGQRLAYLGQEANITITGQQYSFLSIGGYAFGQAVNSFHNGSIAHMALYDHVLTPTRVMQHYLAGRTGFAGEGVSDRVNRIINYAGIGPGSVEQASMPVAAQDDDAPGPALSRLATTEQGLFFISPAGVPTFFNRSHRYDPNTPTLTLDATQDLGDSIQPVKDDQKLINDVQVVSPAGTSRVFDAASQNAHGEYATSLDSLAANSITADDTARWIIATRKDQYLRCPDITVDVLTCTPAVRAAALACNLFDHISVINLPPGFQQLANTVQRGRSETWKIDDQQIVFHTIANPPPGTIYRVGVGGQDEVTTSTARLGW
jgi:hypothetical protein